jgi:hypothetical protein
MRFHRKATVIILIMREADVDEDRVRRYRRDVAARQVA